MRAVFAAAVIAAALIHLPVTARAETVPAEAKAHFTAGVNLLQDPSRPRYEEAYREFKAAYLLAPVPTILGNIGLCAMKLERDAEAIDAYERYLREASDISPEEREQISRDLVVLRSGVVPVVVEVRPGSATILDTRIPAQGEGVTNTYGPVTGRLTLSVRRGHHLMRARPQGNATQDVVWEFDADQPTSHVFVLEEPKSNETPAPIGARTPQDSGGEGTRPVPASVYAAGGVSLALFGVAAVVGVLGASKQSDYERANDGTAIARAEELRSDGQTLNAVADGFLIGGVVATAVTAYLYLSRPRVAPQTALRSSVGWTF